MGRPKLNFKDHSQSFWLALPIVAVIGWFGVDRLIRDGTAAPFEEVITLAAAPAAVALPATPSAPAAAAPPAVAARQPAGTIDAKTVCATTAGDQLVIGDVIGVKVFERGAVPLNGADDTPQNIAFERRDLSGEIEIGADGTAALPLLGRVSFAGRGLACAEALVARDLAHQIRFDGQVTMAFVRRPVVLVNGAVARPGTYAYTPALTLGRLLVQAGSAAVGGPPEPAQLVAIRDQIDALDTDAAVLILELARNEALLAGSRTLKVAAEDAARVTRQIGPDALAAEGDILVALLEATAADVAAADQRIATDRNQIEMLGTAIAGLEQEVAVLRERRDLLEAQRRPRSLVSSATYDATLGLLAVERILLDRRQALTQTQERLDQALRDNELAAALRERETRLAIRDAAIALRRINRQIATLARQTNQGAARSSADEQYFIERPVASGFERIEGVSDTLLLPGDLVHVQPTTVSADMPGDRRVVPAAADEGSDG